MIREVILGRLFNCTIPLAQPTVGKSLVIREGLLLGHLTSGASEGLERETGESGGHVKGGVTSPQSKGLPSESTAKSPCSTCLLLPGVASLDYVSPPLLFTLPRASANKTAKGVFAEAVTWGVLVVSRGRQGCSGVRLGSHIDHLKLEGYSTQPALLGRQWSEAH